MNTHDGVLLETCSKRESVFKRVIDYNIWNKNIYTKTFRLATIHTGLREDRTLNQKSI